jgi:hypothetical protein
MNTSKIYEQLFGSLDRKYCMYYQVLMYVSFAMFATSAITVGMGMVSKGSLRLPSVVSLMSLASAFIAYFSSRLLYSVCIR